MEINTIRLKQEMKRKNIRNQDLAKIVGVTPSQVSRYVCGNRQPGGYVLVAIAEALDTTPEYLCGLGLEHKDMAFARVRGNIAQYAFEWTADQRRELINMLI